MTFNHGVPGSIPGWATNLIENYADVAELADALDLGSSAYGVGVRLPSSAPQLNLKKDAEMAQW